MDSDLLQEVAYSLCEISNFLVEISIKYQLGDEALGSVSDYVYEADTLVNLIELELKG